MSDIYNSKNFSTEKCITKERLICLPDLFTYQPRRPLHAFFSSIPAREEQLSEEGIERLLHTILLVAPSILLLL